MFSVTTNTTIHSTSGSEVGKLKKKQKHELGAANMDSPISDRQLKNNSIRYCDELGAANMDSPILDRQLKNISIQYCGVIVHTDHFEQCEKAIQKYFANPSKLCNLWLMTTNKKFYQK